MKGNDKGGGSGTLAVDFYRDGMGLAAANVLKAGHGLNLTSASHLNGSELCVECIVRLGKTDPSKSAVATAAEIDNANKAVYKLLSGLGEHKVQADHSGNTCTAVIAAATT